MYRNTTVDTKIKCTYTYLRYLRKKVPIGMYLNIKI